MYKYAEFLSNYKELCSQHKEIIDLQCEIGNIVDLFRDSVHKYELFLDQAFDVDSLMKATELFGISTTSEPDLVWIPYLFCVMMLKFTDFLTL